MGHLGGGLSGYVRWLCGTFGRRVIWLCEWLYTNCYHGGAIIMLLMNYGNFANEVT